MRKGGLHAGKMRVEGSSPVGMEIFLFEFGPCEQHKRGNMHHLDVPFHLLGFLWHCQELRLACIGCTCMYARSLKQ